jgi:hypothetical protein
MLAVNAYAPDHVAACRNRIAADMAAYEAASPPAALDPVFYGMMAMALDHWFCHRQRSIEGKDGNPLNEVRMITDSIQGNDGRGPIIPVLAPNSTIKYRPERSVLGLEIGDPLDLGIAAYQKLAIAFLDEVEARFPSGS